MPATLYVQTVTLSLTSRHEGLHLKKYALRETRYDLAGLTDGCVITEQ